MKLKFLLLGICSLALGTSLMGQEKNCGTTQAQKRLLEAHPELKEKIAANELIMNSVIESGKKTRTQIIIPVVFHIIHNFGVENLPEANITNAIDVINQDYHKQNPDVGNTVPIFQSLVADCQFTFKLATKDPNGNCTNGIDRINSYKTYFGSDQSKFNPWNPARYLNIWVVNTLGGDGKAAAYAYYPSTGAVIPYYDGVISLYDYVGSMGPSSTSHMHALSHEIAHYLNLQHTWGSTNDPEVSCGDDGVNDTPETKGHYSCPLNHALCNPPIVENVQNFMEYSYCSTMFTIGQKERMEYALASNVAFRNRLYQDSNIQSTGCMLPKPTCAPHSSFKQNKQYACTGDAVILTAASWGATGMTYEWSSPDGTFTSTTTATTNVSFSTPGWHTVSLTTTAAGGSNTLTKSNLIYVSDANATAQSSDMIETFENPAVYDSWGNINYFNNSFKWDFTDSAGYWGYRSLMYRGWDNRQGWDQTVGSASSDWDDIVTPKYDITPKGTANTYLSFYHSASTTDKFDKDSLVIYYSTNCGVTWNVLKTLKYAELFNNGLYFEKSYFPKQANEWKLDNIKLPSGAVTDKTQFKFRYYPSDYSNNLFIDNIGLSTFPNGVPQVESVSLGIQLFPNPNQGEFVVVGQFEECNQSLNMVVRNLFGQIVYEHKLNTDYTGKTEQKFTLPETLPNGTYTVTVQTQKQPYSDRVHIVR